MVDGVIKQRDYFVPKDGEQGLLSFKADINKVKKQNGITFPLLFLSKR